MAVRASTWSELQCKLPWRGAPMPSNCATGKDGRRNGEMKLLSIVLWNRPQSTPESRPQTLSVDMPRDACFPASLRAES